MTVTCPACGSTLRRRREKLIETDAALSLRALQKLDELATLDGHRYLLIEAETRLGDMLGLDCTGVPAIWNADGSVAGFDHNGDTCPIHEWLVPDDAPVPS
jgi:hypothetical protein